jgi:hypothetical protein
MQQVGGGMSEVNPYASPRSLDDYPVVLIAEAVDSGLYRKGRLLVMHKQAVLPDVCIKSNQPAHGRRLKRKLSWHHPAIYLALVAGVPIFVILALVLRKQATIYTGLSEPWFRKRRWAIFGGWASFLIGLALIIGAAVSADRHPTAALAIPVGVVVMLGGMIYGSVVARIVSPKRITDDYVWLAGAHPDFLADLPPWPSTP